MNVAGQLDDLLVASPRCRTKTSNKVWTRHDPKTDMSTPNMILSAAVSRLAQHPSTLDLAANRLFFYTQPAGHVSSHTTSTVKVKAMEKRVH